MLLKWRIILIVVLFVSLATISTHHPTNMKNNDPITVPVYSKLSSKLYFSSVNDYGLDTDNNSLFDYLHFNINFYDALAGQYVTFKDDLYSLDAYNQTNATLKEGTSTILPSTSVGYVHVNLDIPSETILANAATSQFFKLKVSIDAIGTGLYAAHDALNYTSHEYNTTSWDTISTPPTTTTSSTTITTTITTSTITTTTSSSTPTTTETPTTSTTTPPQSSTTESPTTTSTSSSNPPIVYVTTITKITQSIVSKSGLSQEILIGLVALVSFLGLGVSFYSYRVKNMSHMPRVNATNQRQRFRNELRCPKCFQRYEPADVYCQNCGYKLF